MVLQHKPQHLVYWVWLLHVFGAASAASVRLLWQHGDPKTVYDILAETGKLPKRKSTYIDFTATLREAEQILAQCERSGIRIITMADPCYPVSLRQIHTPPVMLYALGNPALMQAPMRLGVVGTREEQPYTRGLTRQIVTAAAQWNFTVVSGFADGIDNIAMQAAFEAGAGVIGVLGCGVDRLYPVTDGAAALRRQMLASQNGLFLSEYEPGADPIGKHFPLRNRIISGLSEGVAVMESSVRSGSLITARYAEEQGRTLFCVPPHDILNPAYAGQMELLRRGAVPLTSVDDLLQHFSVVGRSQQSGGQTVPPIVRRACPEPPAELEEPRETSVLDLPEIPAPLPAKKKPPRKKPKPAAPVTAGTQPQAAAPAKPAPYTEHRRIIDPPAPDARYPEQKLITENRPDVPKRPATELGQQVVDYLMAYEQADSEAIADALDVDPGVLMTELLMLEAEGILHQSYGGEYRLGSAE